ncbi:heme exporter protein CcmD [Thioclava sp. SK-1]|uniref:heme exporter protein CcmD n=1 Tax=Thioclava sp. SK-1 TaxID=1889770 RepID=UPI000824778D|nr:heme exporter protein CcmD [Thioclava sp. SK-1]OCX63088.1 heme exporter protein CcmD [Thioclava sp. SK-1]
MMPELDKYANTVLISWGVTLVLLAALVAATLWRSARVKRALQAQEIRMRADNG